MIAKEREEQKYDKSTHLARFQRIAEHWDTILQILDEELPTADRLRQIMDTIGISCALNTIGVDAGCAKLTFKATKDIRDKYVLSRLAWNLGILDDLANAFQ